MKKRTKLYVVFAVLTTYLMLLATVLSAQVNVSVGTNYTLNKTNTTLKLGYNFSIAKEFQINEYLLLVPEIEYSKKQIYTTIDLKTVYLNMPIKIILNKYLVGIGLNTGYSFYYANRSKYNIGKEFIIGYTPNEKFEIQFKYSSAINKTFEYYKINSLYLSFIYKL